MSGPNESFYLSLNPDVTISGVNPFGEYTQQSPSVRLNTEQLSHARQPSDMTSDSAAAQPASSINEQTSSDANSGPPAVVIVDAAIEDAQSLLAGIDPSANVHFLDPASDGIQQISQILSDYSGLSEVHILSHGAAGSVTLGSTNLNTANLDSYAAEFSDWDMALANGADILFYGCNVAGDNAGRDFIDRLADLTNADVAASDDLTSSSSLGGDWDLEVATGVIGAVSPLDGGSADNYAHKLDTTLTTGDAVVIQYDGSYNSWSLLLLEDLAAGSTFFVTDLGWNENINSLDTPEIFGKDDIDQITLTQNLAAGTVISSTGGTGYTIGTNVSGTPDSNMSLSSDGDGLIIYETDNDTALGNETLIYAFNNANFAKHQEFLDRANLGFATTANNPDPHDFWQAISHFANGKLTVVNADRADGTAFGLIGLNGEPGSTRVDFGGVFNGDAAALRKFIHDPANWTTIRGTSSDFSDTAFTITANTAPVIGNLAGTVAFVEGGTPLLIDVGTDSTVTDADSVDFIGGNLTATITAGGNAAEDVLSFATGGLVSLPSGITAGSNVSVNGLVVGTLGNNIAAGNDLVVNFNSAYTTLAAVQVLIQALTYQNTDTSDPTSTARTVSVTVDDGDVGGTSTAANITVNVAAVNDAPTVSGLATDIVFTEDTAGDVNLSASTISDVDSTSITVTLTASEGTFSAPVDEAGVIESLVNSTTITLAGSAANINTYLDTASNIQWTGATDDNGNDTSTFTITANDGDGSGDAALGTVNADITAVNDLPALGGTPADDTATEDVATAIDLSAYNVSDVDGDTLTLTLAVDRGTIASTDGNGATAGVTVANSGTASMTLQGTVANLNTYLNDTSKITYTTASNDTTTAVLTVTPNDGTADGAADTVSITINAANDDPEISGLVTDIGFTEDTAGNVNLSASTITDVDSASLTVTLTASEGTFSAPVDEAGVTETLVNSTTITLVGSAANINTYLDTASNIQWTGATDDNGNDTSTFTITANDGDGSGDAALGTVNADIAVVNDPPAVGNVFGDSASQVIAGGGAQDVTDLNDATVSNTDSADYNGGFLTLSQTSGTANGFWGLDGTSATSGGDAPVSAGETVQIGGTTIGTVDGTDDGQGGNTLTIDFTTADATSARIQTLIQALTYSSPSGVDSRDFTLTLNDNDGTANGGDEDASGSFTLQSVSSPPVISNLDGDSLTFTEGDSATGIDVGGDAAVADADSMDFDGGTLTVAYQSGQLAEDLLVIDTSGTISLSAGQTAGSTVSVGATAIGTIQAGWTGASGEDLIVNLGTDATAPRVQTLLQSLQYDNTGGTNPTDGNRVLDVTIADGDGATSSAASITINVDPVAAPSTPTPTPTVPIITFNNDNDNDSDITGDSGDDTLGGGGGNDSVAAGAGNDIVYGGTGNDTVAGGDGNDLLFGGDGNDSLAGGNGDDTLYVGNGDNTAFAGDGSDTVVGGGGDDTLGGGEGDDEVFAGAGSDKVFGGGGNDALYAGEGNDTLFGGAGNDEIGGGAGGDMLFAGTGSDTVYGGGGDDTLNGGAGDDLLFGGPGNDTIVFESSGGADEIIGFEVPGDNIDLTDFGFGSLTDALNSATQSGGNVVFDFGGGDTLLIQGIDLSDLTESNLLI